MADHLKLAAQSREDQGKGASRRLRRLESKVPAIIYGSGEPTAITIMHKEIYKIQESEAFYSSILDLEVDGKVEPVLLKDLQRHPSKPLILHADFQRVDLTKEIQVYVPIHFMNEDICPGVKLEGGNVAHLKTSIEVECLPNNLPEYIEVDMQALSIGDILHITDVKLPEGVTSVAMMHELDLAIAQVNAPLREEDLDLDSPVEAPDAEDEDGEDGEGEEGESEDKEGEDGDDEADKS